MDKSKKYAKMCQKALEIQKLWKPQVGDWIYVVEETESQKNVCIIGYIKGDIVEIYCPSTRQKYFIPFQDLANAVWLPRQDQLQEMIEHESIEDDITSFYAWWNYTVPLSYQDMFNSWEQVRLAYDMWAKYNKIWDGKDWVKSSW